MVWHCSRLTVDRQSNAYSGTNWPSIKCPLIFFRGLECLNLKQLTLEFKRHQELFSGLRDLDIWGAISADLTDGYHGIAAGMANQIREIIRITVSFACSMLEEVLSRTTRPEVSTINVNLFGHSLSITDQRTAYHCRKQPLTLVFAKCVLWTV